MNEKRYIDICRWLDVDDDQFWGIWFDRQRGDLDINPKNYIRRPGSPSALRCARLLAKIAESEAKQ